MRKRFIPPYMEQLRYKMRSEFTRNTLYSNRCQPPKLVPISTGPSDSDVYKKWQYNASQCRSKVPYHINKYTSNEDSSTTYNCITRHLVDYGVKQKEAIRTVV